MDKAEEVIRSRAVSEKANDYCSLYYDWDNEAERRAVIGTFKQGYYEGYKHAEKDLGWHSVEEFLPSIDEEVIVLTDDIYGKTVEGANRICFGHIVNKRHAKDYNGWNIPGVHH